MPSLVDADAAVAARAVRGLLEGLRPQRAVRVLDEALVAPALSVVDAVLEVAAEAAALERRVGLLGGLLGRALLEPRRGVPGDLARVAQLLEARRELHAARRRVEVAHGVQQLGALGEQPGMQARCAPVRARTARGRRKLIASRSPVPSAYSTVRAAASTPSRSRSTPCRVSSTGSIATSRRAISGFDDGQVDACRCRDRSARWHRGETRRASGSAHRPSTRWSARTSRAAGSTRNARQPV